MIKNKQTIIKINDIYLSEFKNINSIKKCKNNIIKN